MKKNVFILVEGIIFWAVKTGRLLLGLGRIKFLMNEEKRDHHLAIASKLNNGQFFNTSEHAFNFTKDCSRPIDTLTRVANDHSINIKKDLYGNEKFESLTIKANRSRARVNILKLFKPGELLSSIVVES